MALSFEPIQYYSLLASLLLVGTALSLPIRAFLDLRAGEPCLRVLGRGRTTKIVHTILYLLAGLFFVLAAYNPRLIRQPEESGTHLELLIDVSASSLRAEGGWQGIRQRAHKRLRADIRALPIGLAKVTSAGITTFRTQATSPSEGLSLASLPAALIGLDSSGFAGGRGTDLEVGLAAAARQVEASGSGAVLLLSDGYQNHGNALEAAQRLAAKGIPVHIYPISGARPALSVSAANLPRRARAGVPTFLRGVVHNGRRMPVNATLNLAQNAGAETGSRFGSARVARKSFALDADAWGRIHQALVFTGPGLQFLDLVLDDGSGGEPHRRRFFTFVDRPPRIYAIAGDTRWTSAIGPDLAEVIEIGAQDLSTEMLRDADALIISGEPATSFRTGVLDAVAKAVSINGMGLLLVNGDHEDASEEGETVIMSYAETALAPLLPVIPGPRPFMSEPASRHVVILIDNSGSMCGANLVKAREIAAYIIAELLREKDLLDLITFDTGATHWAKALPMDDGGKEKALAALARIPCGGGTDPNAALKLIGNRSLGECGLIFISDGYFANVAFRPDCRATAFAIGRTDIPTSSPLWELADPIPVGASFSPKQVRIPFFQPEERKKFFERGRFRALSMDILLRARDRLPVPDLPIYGAAVTHLREDAILNAIRPKLRDPVLVYRRAGAGQVGTFTAAFSREWRESGKGSTAIKAWVERILPFTGRGRYDFKIKDLGKQLQFRVNLVAHEGLIPRVDGLSATLEWTGGGATGLHLRPVPGEPGSFAGRLSVVREATAKMATLLLRESGPGALPRPQRLAFLLPPRAMLRSVQTDEDYSHGLDEDLLSAIAVTTGGIYDPEPGTPFFSAISPEAAGRALWSWFAIAGAVCYLLAITFRRWDP